LNGSLFGNWTTAAKTLEDKGFNESYNGSARVINLCTFRSQPMQNKQIHHLDIFIVEAGIYRQTSGKIPKLNINPFSNTHPLHPCVRCPTRRDRGPTNYYYLLLSFFVPRGT